MRTGIFAFLKSKKQAVNDSNFSFGKTVLEAVKNSKGTTEEELAGEMKGVLDSMSILKDCEAKTKLVDVVKDCFDNKEMALADEAELTATLDSMWIDIHSDSLGEIAKAFAVTGYEGNISLEITTFTRNIPFDMLEAGLKFAQSGGREIIRMIENNKK